ncbi:uncharacterized membrane protein YjjP (DUF1212 family) [Crossiella equi]|uniref:Uncharacterized membrane protein YjjP (DUF1212 family) n=1 Tax=Crossiella equi TaxID=130796 RepID=A0ABS5A8N2_9PSEU|nr:threonine/serine exporter family protein [Crossiella equi]MBP2472950.1 uncharacterized membrane protein YjjP (DUF1212 family) [Crossiella equi]
MLHGPKVPDAPTVHQVLDLALRVGELQLASGAGAADVTATMLAVTGAYGLPSTDVDVTFTSITACCHRGNLAAPVTTTRVVRARSLDYTRLAALERVVRRITAGDLTAEQGLTELDEVSTAKHPYPRWMATLAWAAMAASVAVLLGGGVLLTLIAAFTTAVIDRVGRVVNRRGLPFFFQQVIGGALATGMALAVHALDPTGLYAKPSLVVATGIVVLLSGLAIVGSVQDAITGYNVTAAGRAMEVLILTAGLVIGVLLVLRLAVSLGFPLSLAEPPPPFLAHVPLMIVAGGLTSLCFAWASYATPLALGVAGIAGALGTAGYGLLTVLGIDMVVASAGAAVVIGFVGGVISRRWRIPPLVIAVSGLTPLLPGLTTYHALFRLAVEQDIAEGGKQLLLAAGIGLALAAGVVLGEYLAQPVRTGLGRLGRKLAGPRLSGPVRPVETPLE